MRVATGGLSHESSTFTPVPTTVESYRERFLLEGEEILSTFAGTNTPIGGFIEGAEAHGFELIPTLFGEPHPSAPTPRPLYDELLGRILDGIAKAMPLDGVLLELHGSMSVGDLDGPDGLGDGEGHLLAAVRETVGPGRAGSGAARHSFERFAADGREGGRPDRAGELSGGGHVGARPRVRGRAGADCA